MRRLKQHKANVFRSNTVAYFTGSLTIFLSGLWACSSPAQKKIEPVQAQPRPLTSAAEVQPVEIEIGLKASGQSLVVNVVGMGRGHQSGEAMENPKAWKVLANHQGAPLKQVLAGPAKISREPTGLVSGNQWDVEVQFTVAFAVPNSLSGQVELEVLAPGGEKANRTWTIQ